MPRPHASGVVTCRRSRGQGPVIPSARRGLSTRTACVAASPSSDAQRLGVGPVAAQHDERRSQAPAPARRAPARRTTRCRRTRSGRPVRSEPPRAVSRSWWTGASPAPAAKTSLSLGNCERPPKACQAHQAACSCATYPTTGAHHDGTSHRGRRGARVHEHRLAGELGDAEDLAPRRATRADRPASSRAAAPRRRARSAGPPTRPGPAPPSAPTPRARSGPAARAHPRARRR